MGLGLGIFLIVVGAVMSFGVSDRVDGVDLVTIGYILMGAGVLSIVLGLVMNQQRRNTTHREVVERHEDVDRRDRRIDER